MGFMIFLHTVVCALLVVTILMQTGRGGGLTEAFASTESMLGAQTNKVMVRITTVLTVIFLATALILAFMSSKKDKSLMASVDVPAQAASEAAQAVENIVEDVEAQQASESVEQRTENVPETASEPEPEMVP